MVDTNSYKELCHLTLSNTSTLTMESSRIQITIQSHAAMTANPIAKPLLSIGLSRSRSGDG